MNISASPFTDIPAPEGRADRENRVYCLLKELGIPIYGFDHERADTMDICEKIEETLGAKICKNLFLCNAQATNFYLLMTPGRKVFKTKFLSKQINSSRLSFGSAENMKRYLDVLPGCVSVLGLMNDKEKKVKLLIDKDLLSQEYIGVHPCVNTSALKMKTSDILDKFLPSLGVTPTVIVLPNITGV